MKVNILYQFFQGDEEAGHNLIQAFARHLQQHGAVVAVVSGDYGYMQPRKPARPLWRGLLRHDSVAGVPVVRTYSYPYGHSSLHRRMLSMASFTVSCLLGLLRGPRPDIIYASSPPLPPAMSAWVASRIRGVPLALEVRDLWPASLVELGPPSSRFAIAALSWMERFLYDRSAVIVTLTEGMRRDIVARGWPPQKVHTFGYGVSEERFFPDQDAAKRIRAVEGWENVNVVLYLGSHGLANNLDVVIRAAQRLRQRRDIRFVLIGDGLEKETLISRARAMDLDNVVFHAPVPARQAAEYINAADLCVATLRDIPLFRSAIPSKMIEYMACGKAVVIGLRGEAEEIVRTAGAGLVFDPDDDGQLAASVVELLDAPSRRDSMARAGRAHVCEHFSLARNHAALQALLEATVRAQ